MNPQPEKRGLFNLRFLGILGIALFFIVAVAYFFYGLQPVSYADGENVHAGAIQFKIVRGDGFRTIGAHLSQQSLIKSITVFKLYSILMGQAQKFQPGIYELSPTMSVPQILQILTAGGKNEVTVTIPEGTTLLEVNTLLTASSVLEAKSSLLTFPFLTLAPQYPFLVNVSSLEGFLFPDTYRFKLGSTPGEVLSMFLDNFMLKAWPLLANTKNWYDSLILASYLEKEVPGFNDRQIVAGIILKRLTTGMPLQIDATVSYAKCGGELRSCENPVVVNDDLKITSPYNTYARLGWTPTPIGNPGQGAIKAALTPKSSPYFYYLSTAKTKETLFSRTLDEHNAKRAKYL